MNLKEAVIRYVENITGHAPILTPLPKGAAVRVPVFLMELYELFRVKLFQRDLALAVGKEHKNGFTPMEYMGHAEQLRDALGEIVALVLPHVASYDRNRLVRMGVAFIVPERQLFLPQLLVDLRNHFPRAKRNTGEALPYPAQVILLYHLLKSSVEHYSLREVAERLGYSPMTISNAVDGLKGFGLCETRAVGRKYHLHFKARGRKLWEEALPHLRSPVRARRFVRGKPAEADAFQAGMTALSAYTRIGDDRLPVYAMREDKYRQEMKTGRLIECPGPDEAEAEIEAWFYSPEPLAEVGRVDRLSLFLTFRDSPDERVAQARRELMEGLRW